MGKIVDILMTRDGMTKEEATRVYNNTQAEILVAVEDGCFDEVEDILRTNVGLELDYVDYFLI